MEQPLSRRERERLARRHTMLDAARVVIAEKGFRHATLDEIAQRAEFGKGTIYNYFPNGKDEMLFAILDDVYADLYAISVEAFDSAGSMRFEQRLRGYVEATLSYYMRQRDLFVIVMKEANRIAFGEEESKVDYFRCHLERLVGILAPSIEAATAAGELKPYPPESIAHMILGNVHGYLRYTCFQAIGEERSDAETDAEAARVAEFLCGILLNGMAAETTLVETVNGREGTEEDAS